MSKGLLREITILNYPSKIKLSEKRIARYYKKGKTKKKVPKKYSNINEYNYNDKGFLINLTTKERVIANPLSVGTPRYWVVNFQSIWNQAIKHQQRAVIINKLKDLLKPYITPIEAIAHYPIRIELFLYDTEMKVDVDNKGVIYTKVITDLLVKENKILDDSSQYVNDTGRCKFIKVNTEEERKMIIKIWESN
jgi:hypothetical protein